MNIPIKRVRFLLRMVVERSKNYKQILCQIKDLDKVLEKVERIDYEECNAARVLSDSESAGSKVGF